MVKLCILILLSKLEAILYLGERMHDIILSDNINHQFSVLSFLLFFLIHYPKEGIFFPVALFCYL